MTMTLSNPVTQLETGLARLCAYSAAVEELTAYFAGSPASPKDQAKAAGILAEGAQTLVTLPSATAPWASLEDTAVQAALAVQEQHLSAYQRIINRFDDYFEYAMHSKVDQAEVHAILATLTQALTQTPTVIWAEDTVNALNAHQHAGQFHPYTCGNRSDGHHPDDAVLVATPYGWRCEHCAYTQNWAHGLPETA